MNSITVIGNLGADPELKYTPSGTPVCNFSVADNHRYKDAAGKDVETVEWFRVSAWGQQGDACNQWLQKGSLVCVIGRLSTRLYETRNDEVDVSLDINAVTVQFLSGTRSRDDAPPATSAKGKAKPKARKAS